MSTEGARSDSNGQEQAQGVAEECGGGGDVAAVAYWPWLQRSIVGSRQPAMTDEIISRNFRFSFSRSIFALYSI